MLFPWSITLCHYLPSLALLRGVEVWKSLITRRETKIWTNINTNITEKKIYNKAQREHGRL